MVSKLPGPSDRRSHHRRLYRPASTRRLGAATRRGKLYGLVEFSGCAVRTIPDEGRYEIILNRPRTIRFYRGGAELLPLLGSAVSTEPADLLHPDWLCLGLTRDLRSANSAPS